MTSPCAHAGEPGRASGIAFPDPRLTVHGCRVQRGHARLAPSAFASERPLSFPVWDLAQDPSGGRSAFAPDSTTVGLIAENPLLEQPHGQRGRNGFDLYVGRIT